MRSWKQSSRTMDLYSRGGCEMLLHRRWVTVGFGRDDHEAVRAHVVSGELVASSSMGGS